MLGKQKETLHPTYPMRTKRLLFYCTAKELLYTATPATNQPMRLAFFSVLYQVYFPYFPKNHMLLHEEYITVIKNCHHRSLISFSFIGLR